MGLTRAPAVELDRAAVVVSSLPMSNTCNLHTEDEQEDESGDGVSFPNYPRTGSLKGKRRPCCTFYMFYLCKVPVF